MAVRDIITLGFNTDWEDGQWSITRGLLPLQETTGGRQRERTVVCYDEAQRMSADCDSGENRHRGEQAETLQEREQSCQSE